MSKIWCTMLIISIIVALFFGNSGTVITSIMNSGKTSTQNVINLIGIMCFWSGIFNVFEHTNAIKKFSTFFSKILSKIFDKSKLSEKSLMYMSMNITSNILGVGNAATLNGIRAIKSLNEDNQDKEKPDDNMTTFVLINTASIQLIPTSIIGLRAAYGSLNPTDVVIPIWIVTAISLIFGLISIKILNKKMR